MARELVKEQRDREERVIALQRVGADPETIRREWTRDVSYIGVARKVIQKHGVRGAGTIENRAKRLAAEFDYFCLAGPAEVKRYETATAKALAKGKAPPRAARGWGAKLFSDKENK